MEHGDCIWCCQCGEAVKARLVTGAEIYPHREDLKKLPFWKCERCKNFVGCHHKTKDPTRPLGCIPNAAIKRARNHIHRILDPIWRRGKLSRKQTYDEIAALLDVDEYHTANIKSIEEGRDVYRAVVALRKRLGLSRKDL